MVAGLFARRPHRRHRQRRLRARPDDQAVGHGDGPIEKGLARREGHGGLAGFFARRPHARLGSPCGERQRPNLGRGDRPAAGDPRRTHRPRPGGGFRSRWQEPGNGELRRNRPALGRRLVARAQRASWAMPTRCTPWLFRPTARRSPRPATMATSALESANRVIDCQPRVLHNRANLMAMAFAPDGKTLAVADSLGSIDDLGPRTVDAHPLDPQRWRRAPPGGVHARRRPRSPRPGSRDVIRLWDPATGQELVSLPAHRAQINGLAFSPDGSILGSVAHDGSVRLWRADP